MRVRARSRRPAVDAPTTWPSCAVDEDPVVELATPAMEIGVADEPADLREGRLERRAVDGDPAAACPRALDDLDAAVLGGRPRCRGSGRSRGPGGRRSRPSTSTGRPGPSRRRVPRPGVAADPRGAGLAELAIGGDVREPAEVAAVARPDEVDRRRSAGGRRSRAGAIESGRRVPASSAPSQRRRLALRVGRAEARRRRGPCRARRARWRRPRRRRAMPDRSVSTTAMSSPVEEPPPAQGRPHREPPGDAEAAEEAGGEPGPGATGRPPRTRAGASASRAPGAAR